jgi:hypothetical protein
MSTWGNASKNTNHKKYQIKQKGYEFIIDETQNNLGSQHVWPWVAIEPKHIQILKTHIF